MTVCELIVVPLVIGIVSGVISAYIVKFIDNKDKEHKNDRHSPKSGH